MLNNILERYIMFGINSFTKRAVKKGVMGEIDLVYKCGYARIHIVQGTLYCKYLPSYDKIK